MYLEIIMEFRGMELGLIGLGLTVDVGNDGLGGLIRMMCEILWINAASC